MPDPPVFEKIELADPDNIKLLKLYNNITRLKAYTEKLKAVIICLQDGEEKKETAVFYISAVSGILTQS